MNHEIASNARTTRNEPADGSRQIVVPPPTHRFASWLGSVPIFYKVLIANATVVVIGALAGTWITIETVQRAPEGEFLPLSLIFVIAGIFLSVAGNWLVLRVAFRPLSELQRVGWLVRQGDLSARANTTGVGDPALSELAATLNLTLDELEQDRSELRSLASQVIRAQEEERRRISRELHDDTAQLLFAQLLRLTALKSSPEPALHQAANEMEVLTVEALEGVRRLALELRPPALDDLGLEAAVGSLVQRFSEQLHLPIAYDYRGLRGRLPPDIELVLYRVAQEALTNIAKHSGATSGRVSIERGPDDVTLVVRDDGRGFDLNSTRASDDTGLGLGLFGMEERLVLVGGRFQISTTPNRGTVVFAHIPVRDNAIAGSS